MNAVSPPPVSTADDSLPALVLARAIAEPQRTILRRKRFGLWKLTSGEEFTRSIADCAAGLAVLGLQAGETAGILAASSPEWLVADLAIQAAGGVSAGFHAEAAPGEFVALVRQCGTSVLFVDAGAVLDTARELAGLCANLRAIVCFDAAAAAETGDDRVLSMDQLIAMGAASPGRRATPWRDRAGTARAAIIPTSGVSAPSKAAIFTHAALRAAVDAALSMVEFRSGEERLSLMAASHPFERIFGLYAGLVAGIVLNFPESAETSLDNLRELQPQIVAGPPAFWSGLARSLARAGAAATRLQRAALESALRSDSGFADWLVLRKVRADLGLLRVRLALSAGAPLSSEVRRRCAAIRIEIADIYALAEAGGAIGIARNAPRSFTLARGAAVEIGPQGDILLRAASAFSGYIGEAETATDCITTGDFGSERASGHLDLHGSRKAAISGEAATFSFWAVEEALSASAYVAACIVSGMARESLSAIILIDYDNVVSYAQARAMPFTHYKSLVDAEDIRKLFANEIARVNAAVAPARIVDFQLADRPVGSGDAEMGPAMNLRRRIVLQSFSERGG